MSRGGPATGTAYHPEIEPEYNGSRRRPMTAGQLAKLPRRRRPGMIALAVALVGAGVLASVAVYGATDLRVPVIVLTANVPAGTVITAADLSTANVSVSAGVQVIPARQMSQVVGQVAGTSLHPGMLLTASELATVRPPAAGEVLIPLPIKQSFVPASGIGAGDHVLIEATPGAQGQTGSSNGAAALATPVAGIVEAVNLAPDADGFDVIDVLVAQKSGDAVAAQASTGQIALIVTKRAA
ncbi:MAG TPA: SAF domain-containing protein [Streptosporangiaceae bacterium]|nr:SAF domain-containing protein [Streptosporangiaceae bacterium]